MIGAPRLHSFRINLESLRNLVELLGYKAELKRSAVVAFHVAVSLSHVLFEIFEEIFPYDIYDFAETGLNSIID